MKRMENLSTLERTLFVPLVGRIYASERFPGVLRDEKALSLKSSLPPDLEEARSQTQYTLLAGAIRSVKIDRHIAGFLQRKPDGVIVQLGCGLETTFHRMDNGRTRWIGVDLPAVIDYRRTLLPESERESLLAADAFSREWIERVRANHPDAPLLVTASGLLYFFTEEKVLSLFHLLRDHGDIEVVFDTVNSLGGFLISHYMKQVGHGKTLVCFHVDRAMQMAEKVGATLLEEERYYEGISKKGMPFSTRTTMFLSDLLMTVKMIHMRFGEKLIPRSSTGPRK